MRVLLASLMIALSSPAYADDFDLNPIPEEELNCLAQNIYFEARDQELVGQVAVAFVTLNRVNSKRYPNTYCGVVRDGYNPSRKDCQFSWYCDGLADTPYEPEAWELSQAVANWVAHQHDYIIDPTNGATHYHSMKVEPWWAPKLSFNGVIGDHLFYVEGDPSERNRSKQ